MEVLVSLNNGQSFISSPITIYATTCVSRRHMLEMLLRACVVTCCGVFPAVRWKLGSLAVPGSSLAAGSGFTLVVLASLLHGGPSLQT